MTDEELKARFSGKAAEGAPTGFGGMTMQRSGGTGVFDAVGNFAHAVGDDILYGIQSIPHLPAAIMPTGKSGIIGAFDETADPEDLKHRRRALADAAMLLSGAGLGKLASVIASPAQAEAGFLLRTLLGVKKAGDVNAKLVPMFERAAGIIPGAKYALGGPNRAAFTIGALENVVFSAFNHDPNEPYNPLVDAAVGGSLGLGGHALFSRILGHAKAGKAGSRALEELEAQDAATRALRKSGDFTQLYDELTPAPKTAAELAQEEVDRKARAGGDFSQIADPYSAHLERQAAARASQQSDDAIWAEIQQAQANPRKAADAALESNMGLDAPTEPPGGGGGGGGGTPAFSGGPGDYRYDLEQGQAAANLAQVQDDLLGAASRRSTVIDAVRLAMQSLRNGQLSQGDAKWLDDFMRRTARNVEGERKSVLDIVKSEFTDSAQEKVRKTVFAEINRHDFLSGEANKDVRLAVASEILGRPVTTFRGLTEAEGKQIVNTLRKLRGEAPMVTPKPNIAAAVKLSRGRGVAAVLFPDADHAVLYHSAQPKGFRPIDDATRARLAEVTGLPVESVEVASQMYRDFVDNTVDVLGLGKHEMPSFAEFLDHHPRVQNHTRQQVFAALTERTNAAEAAARAAAGSRERGRGVRRARTRADVLSEERGPRGRSRRGRDANKAEAAQTAAQAVNSGNSDTPPPVRTAAEASGFSNGSRPKPVSAGGRPAWERVTSAEATDQGMLPTEVTAAELEAAFGGGPASTAAPGTVGRVTVAPEPGTAAPTAAEGPKPGTKAFFYQQKYSPIIARLTKRVSELTERFASSRPALRARVEKLLKAFGDTTSELNLPKYSALADSRMLEEQAFAAWKKRMGQATGGKGGQLFNYDALTENAQKASAAARNSLDDYLLTDKGKLISTGKGRPGKAMAALAEKYGWEHKEVGTTWRNPEAWTDEHFKEVLKAYVSDLGYPEGSPLIKKYRDVIMAAKEGLRKEDGPAAHVLAAAEDAKASAALETANVAFKNSPEFLNITEDAAKTQAKVASLRSRKNRLASLLDRVNATLGKSPEALEIQRIENAVDRMKAFVARETSRGGTRPLRALPTIYTNLTWTAEGTAGRHTAAIPVAVTRKVKVQNPTTLKHEYVTEHVVGGLKMHATHRGNGHYTIHGVEAGGGWIPSAERVAGGYSKFDKKKWEVGVNALQTFFADLYYNKGANVIEIPDGHPLEFVMEAFSGHQNPNAPFKIGDRNMFLQRRRGLYVFTKNTSFPIDTAKSFRRIPKVGLDYISEKMARIKMRQGAGGVNIDVQTGLPKVATEDLDAVAASRLLARVAEAEKLAYNTGDWREVTKLKREVDRLLNPKSDAQQLAEAFGETPAVSEAAPDVPPSPPVGKVNEGDLVSNRRNLAQVEGTIDALVKGGKPIPEVYVEMKRKAVDRIKQLEQALNSLPVNVLEEKLAANRKGLEQTTAEYNKLKQSGKEIPTDLRWKKKQYADNIKELEPILKKKKASAPAGTVPETQEDIANSLGGRLVATPAASATPSTPAASAAPLTAAASPTVSQATPTVVNPSGRLAAARQELADFESDIAEMQAAGKDIPSGLFRHRDLVAAEIARLEGRAAAVTPIESAAAAVTPNDMSDIAEGFGGTVVGDEQSAVPLDDFDDGTDNVIPSTPAAVQQVAAAESKGSGRKQAPAGVIDEYSQEGAREDAGLNEWKKGKGIAIRLKDGDIYSFEPYEVAPAGPRKGLPITTHEDAVLAMIAESRGDLKASDVDALGYADKNPSTGKIVFVESRKAEHSSALPFAPPDTQLDALRKEWKSLSSFLKETKNGTRVHQLIAQIDPKTGPSKEAAELFDRVRSVRDKAIEIAALFEKNKKAPPRELRAIINRTKAMAERIEQATADARVPVAQQSNTATVLAGVMSKLDRTAAVPAESVSFDYIRTQMSKVIGLFEAAKRDKTWEQLIAAPEFQRSVAEIDMVFKHKALRMEQSGGEAPPMLPEFVTLARVVRANGGA